MSTGYDTKYAKSFRHFTREALPRLDNYRNIMSIQAAYRPTLDELHNATVHGGKVGAKSIHAFLSRIQNPILALCGGCIIFSHSSLDWLVDCFCGVSARIWPGVLRGFLTRPRGSACVPIYSVCDQRQGRPGEAAAEKTNENNTKKVNLIW